MTGLQIYNKLLDVYQGQARGEDKAVNAASNFERLKFNCLSHYNPETFLAKINECLKQMETNDEKGGVTRPVSELLLSSMFRAKVDHPIYETWKEISKKKRGLGQHPSHLPE
eukprot:5966558-Ditylum_brightwellii.AAC.1